VPAAFRQLEANLAHVSAEKAEAEAGLQAETTQLAAMNAVAQPSRPEGRQLSKLRPADHRSRPASHRSVRHVRPLRLRYCWASELDLMVRLAGLRLRERYQDWDRGPFTGESQDHISVYEVTAAPAG
jgi:hypothetical protein